MSSCIRSTVFLTMLLLATGGAYAENGVLSAFGALGERIPSWFELGECSEAPRPPGATLQVGYALPDEVRMELSCDVENLIQDFGVGGVWLGLSGQTWLTNRLGVSASGSWLVPVTSEAEEETRFFVNWQDGRRSWDIQSQWYTIDGAFSYRVNPNLTTISGFRFDSFSAAFSEPFQARGMPSSDTDEAEVIVSAYIPFGGLSVNHGSTMHAGIIGSLWVPGDARFAETFGGGLRWEAIGEFDTAYFYEVFSEWRTGIPGGRVGLFGKWNYLHCTSFFHVQSYGNVPDDFTLKLTIDRQNWIVGGNVTIDIPALL